MPGPGPVLRHLPNLISVARILLVPFTVMAFVRGDFETGFWLFVIAGVSDAVDGAIARLFRAQSTLGTYLDPAADKLLLVTMYVALSVQGGLSWAVTVLVLARDLMILGGLAWCLWRKFPADIRPILVSKVNTFLQVFVIAWILSLESGMVARVTGLAPATTDAITLIVEIVMIVTTAVSGLIYAGRWHRLIQGAKGERA